MATDHAGKLHSIRIVDDAGHEEPFSAGNRLAFLKGFLGAVERHSEWRSSALPGRRRRRRCPHLQLSYLDPWGTARDGEPMWITCICPDGRCPLISVQAAFSDGGASLWACIEHTARTAEELAKFFGYHDSGEHRLRDIFNACCEDSESTTPKPKLRLIKNEKKPG